MILDPQFPKPKPPYYFTIPLQPSIVILRPCHSSAPTSLQIATTKIHLFWRRSRFHSTVAVAPVTTIESLLSPLFSSNGFREAFIKWGGHSRILNSQREEFERGHGWTIRTMEEEPSPIRDEYAPVIFSQETVSYIESVDMMSGEVKRMNADISFILDALQASEAVEVQKFKW